MDCNENERKANVKFAFIVQLTKEGTSAKNRRQKKRKKEKKGRMKKEDTKEQKSLQQKGERTRAETTATLLPTK